jgi:hypothetical protein
MVFAMCIADVYFNFCKFLFVYELYAIGRAEKSHETSICTLAFRRILTIPDSERGL